MKKVLLAAIGGAVLVGCNSQSQVTEPSATDHLLIKFTDVGTPESCRVEILSTIAKQVDIYMFEYDLYVNGQKKLLSQLQFSGHDGIDYVRDKTVSLVYENAPCNTDDIEWRNLECINNNRDDMACPDIVFEGDDLFKSLTVDRS